MSLPLSLSLSLFYHHLFSWRQPTFHPPSCRGLKKHRWSPLTCYSSLCQKLCQNNAPQQHAEGFYLFLSMGPVNFTDVSLGSNHQLISFVLIKRLILNMHCADNECCSEPEPDSSAPATGLLECEAGRYGEKMEGQERQHVIGGGVGVGRGWRVLVAGAEKRERALAKPLLICRHP